MLSRLCIRNFAIASHSELEFGAGLTVISGETGAGKSLLVDALGFISGQRADSGMVRHGAERAELTAEFDLDDAPAALDWLREQDMDEAGSCQLRRTLRADGGSRAWINGRPATLAQLGELSGHLVEIHGQHAQQALLSRQRQLDLIDAFGGHDRLLAGVREAAARWSRLLHERDSLNRAGDNSERSEWLQHQLDELDRQPLEPSVLAELDANHRRQAHAAGLIAACDGVLELLGDDDVSPLRRLQQMRSLLGREQRHEPRLAEVDAMLDAAGIQLDEATLLLQRIRDDLDLDPAALQSLEQQLERIHDLARKHRVPADELALHRERLAEEFDRLAHAGERLEHLDREIAAAAADWNTAAGALSQARISAAERLSTATTALIAGLGMGGGRFEVELQPQEAGRPDPQGNERVEFLVSANAGQPPRALRKVASGGELSRISLAIEVASLGRDVVPTMVFDEVDSGIGGAVAEIVGQKLRALGRSRQVLCVTHQPQVAAQGHGHLLVRKADVAGTTESEVIVLDGAQRQEELARMLGGVAVSSEARAAARRLLDDANRKPD